jgi:ring-1,2-phenylacetyl-CoA epoxidase subunit PaaE
MPIIKTDAVITALTDITPTARAVTFKTTTPFTFHAGNFVNVFIEVHGEMLRRAYSISSNDAVNSEFTISVRRTIDGKMSPVFWDESTIGKTISIMGPLGVNTVDKFTHPTVYLVAFGVGAGVIKAVLEHVLAEPRVTKIVLLTGSRTQDEILYRDYFNELAVTNKQLTVEHIISDKAELSTYKKGYIQDHVGGYDFTNSDVYVCGQEAACNGLVDAVKATNPNDVSFFVEGFH